MKSDKPSAEDIETTYDVLEYIRDEWAMPTQDQRDVVNSAHMVVQQLEFLMDAESKLEDETEDEDND